jgi:nucleoside-diphosphate-sugar epimerase
VGIHILDQLDSWLGDPIEVEYADDAMGGVEANAVCRLRYATGSEGVIRLSKERTLANRHRFDFEKGVVCWKVGKPDTLEIQVAGTAASLAGTLLKNGVLPSGTDPQCFIEQLRHVVAVKSGQAARLLIPSAQALRALAVVEKAYERKTLLKMAWLGAEEQTRAMRLAGRSSPQAGHEGGRPTDLIEGRKAIPRVAITGASGFVGSRLVESMHLGDWPFHITPFVRGPNSLARLARLALQFRTADLLDLESTTRALQDCDLLVHAALGDPGQIVRMAEVLSRACARAGVKRVVVISTAAVFGLVAPANSDDHAEPRPPKNEPYALAKLQAEKIFQAAAVRHGFELIILRPSLVYGPRSARMEGLWQSARKGISGIVDQGRGVFNGIYVDNLVEAVRLALSGKVKSGTFYIGDQEQPHWADVYAALGVNVVDLPSIEPPPPHGPSLLERAQSCTANPAIQRLLPWFPGRLKSVTKRVLAALPEKALPNAWVPAPMAPALEIDEELAWLQTTRWRFSSANAEEHLGYKPVFSFGEGMRLTREWLEFSSL